LETRRGLRAARGGAACWPARARLMGCAGYEGVDGIDALSVHAILWHEVSPCGDDNLGGNLKK
jgi:hypothetical protein